MRGSIGFYITNVCNLNCENCSHLNNYAVSGHQRWKDNKDHCKKWAEKLNPLVIFIYGGEPMVNPDFLKWMHGIANIWPDAEIRINTNGTVFHLWPTLYEELLPYRGRVTISISGHNEHIREQQIHWIKNFLRGEIKETSSTCKRFSTWRWKKVYTNIKDPAWPDCNSLEQYEALSDLIKEEILSLHKVNINDFNIYDEPVNDFEVFEDENQIRIGWARWDTFQNAAVKFDFESQTMTLHDSDPEKAIAICHGGDCAHIKDGKFYKCQVMSNLPELIKQNFPLALSQEDKDLIMSYQPAEPSWSDQQLIEFFEGLEKHTVIPQCKFCPETKISQKIHATSKKIKIQKINKNL